MVSHFECWWVFSPYLSRIFTNLVPCSAPLCLYILLVLPDRKHRKAAAVSAIRCRLSRNNLESKRTLETAGYEFPMSAVMKKREKQAILEQQERQATAAGLERCEASIDAILENKQSFVNE
ncbi:hypothetical protein TcWFU_004923 [Taenia crassiceps]|uniref:Uncharacterized protein n=1 Tax=Taenia crassiceps TaxID=6207 RepID=A0ABR4Q717_9CEST